jgi:hypothetical protein
MSNHSGERTGGSRWRPVEAVRVVAIMRGIGLSSRKTKAAHFAEWVEIDRFLTGRDRLYPAGLAERLLRAP